jgi:anti-sigma factor RsiW
MKTETELKLQAHLDGELNPAEILEVESLLAGDVAARDLLAELALVKKCMTGNEPEARVPESREFYWSKIQREIERSSNSAPVRPGWLQLLHSRLLWSTGALAGIALAALFLFDGRGLSSYSQPEEVSNLNEEMNSISFRSEAHQMSVVYLFDRDSGASQATEEPVDSLVQ